MTKVRKAIRLVMQGLKAAVWRRRMSRTTWVSVTGSHGKTTATECLGLMLESHGPTNWQHGGKNWREAVVDIVRATRSSHRFTLLEIGAKQPGALWRAAWTVKPDVVVILAVANVHSDNFPDLDAIAHEKAQLMHRLGRRGVAVLNRDDERVWAMRERCRGRVVSFGRTEGCDFRATEVEAQWPDRLRFRLTTAGESVVVQTRFVGEHWLTSVLGALAAAVTVGVPLEKAVAVVEAIPPTPTRMEPRPLPNGAWMIRDDFNPASATHEAALSVLRNARVEGRRVLVTGILYDGPPNQTEQKKVIGRQAATAADLAVFIGRKLGPAVTAAVASGMEAGTAVNFSKIPQAVDFLARELRAGDLVLLRNGVNRHLDRVYFRLLGDVRCPLDWCNRNGTCDNCPDLGFVDHSGLLERPEPIWFSRLPDAVRLPQDRTERSHA